MPTNLPLEQWDEFLKPHMHGTAIVLRNCQGTGWTQRDPDMLLRIRYPTDDFHSTLAGTLKEGQGGTLVFLDERGCGKSQIGALVHHAWPLKGRHA